MVKFLSRMCAGLLMSAGIISGVNAQQPDGSDIWLGQYSDGATPSIRQLENITQRDGYDNQPWFIPSSKDVYFTRMHTEGETQQTDIYRFEHQTRRLIQVTSTRESEYSPTSTPANDGFSVIRVDEQGKQTLWAYNINGKPIRQLLDDVEPVGYHTWISDTSVGVFVLGEPHSLQLANLNTQTTKTIDHDIGPSLFALPASGKLSYTRARRKAAEEVVWDLNLYTLDSGEIQTLTTLPAGAYYYTWTPSGKVLSGTDSKIYQWDPEQPDMWVFAADLFKECPEGVTRIKVAEDNQRIAVVCNR